MTLALMRCCGTAPLAREYEAATDALLARFGVGVLELDFQCCGYPLRNASFDAYVLSSARNLAVAERARADLVTVCSCCFGTLKHVEGLLRADRSLRRAANAAVAPERLGWSGAGRVRHLVEVLRDEVGLDRIRGARTVSLDGLRVACHYGCHLVRPSDVVRDDRGDGPAVLVDALVEATGATSIPWGAQLDCCGAPVAGVDDDRSTTLTARKLRSARDAGADVLCVVCPYCHLQLERVQRALVPDPDAPGIPVVLVHQLVGLSVGIPPEALGLAALPAALEARTERQGASRG